MIVKVQVSTFTTEKTRQVLIYNESRSVEHQCDLTPDLAEMMAGDLKAFFKARLHLDGTIELMMHTRIAEQGW